MDDRHAIDGRNNAHQARIGVNLNRSNCTGRGEHKPKFCSFKKKQPEESVGVDAYLITFVSQRIGTVEQLSIEAVNPPG